MHTAQGNRSPLVYDLVAAIAERLDRRFGWHRLPTYLGELTLFGLRHRLRQRNLYALPLHEPDPTQEERDQEAEETRRWSRETVRLVSGRYNDLARPRMGAVNTRFGRNTSPRVDKIDSPRPEDVSKVLLARRDFIPATSLNLLAAAWVQFEVHDWFSHRVDGGETWPMPDGALPKLWRDPDAPPSAPAFASSETHWWDGSQLYGNDQAFANGIRDEDGRLLVDDALLERMEGLVGGAPARGEPGTAVSVRGAANMWTGLALLHALFAREHNAICATLKVEHPTWGGDRLYATARLINAAVMAKIHTVEWTPAIIAHPTTMRSIRSTWWGLFGEAVTRRVGRLGPGEVLSGIPGSARNLDGVGYSLTEEFVAVYRMHPLIPDEVALLDAATGKCLDDGVPFQDLAAGHDAPDRARVQLGERGYENIAYSLGVGNPGAITLYNFPEFLRTLQKVDGSRLDLAAVDVLRTRECAIARYNDFRRMFRLAPAADFAGLTDDPVAQRDLADVYGDIEAVDLLVGLYAEAKPQGFAFGDTAFRVFLLMAARRLRSDRFFTEGFSPELYTPAGLRWIADASMTKIIRRELPVLRGVLQAGANPFAPWPTAS